jgi:hypothetical protein
MGLLAKITQLFKTQEKLETTYPSHEYKGYTITPQPLADNGQFRVAALIEKPDAQSQERRQHHFIRSDSFTSSEQAAQLSIEKCKIFIDQVGEQMFN